MTAFLELEPPLVDDLLSALRRHACADSERLLVAWAYAEKLVAFDPAADPDGDPDMVAALDDPLTALVHREVALDVAGGRFEHAVCLVERYRRPTTAAEKAAQLIASPKVLV